MNQAKTHRVVTTIVALAVAWLLAGCSRKTVYSHYAHTPIVGWDRSDSLLFDVAPVSAGGTYDELVGLRISSSYPFMGLTLIVDQHVFPSSLHRIDTLHAHLIDQEGNIQGQGISFFQYQFLLRRLQLNAGDSLHVCIRHAMKRENLPCISDVGFTLIMNYELN